MKSIAKNRKAFFDYYIEDKFEAGITLRGSEVKALRLGHGSLADGCYALVRDGEAYIVNFTIPALKQASHLNHTERRDRKLLLHKKEIETLDRATRQRGYTVVPLEVYFNDEGRVKVELALAKGKAQHDKRDVAKEKDAKKEIDRAMRR
jgi:SsrA-binding protein